MNRTAVLAVALVLNIGMASTQAHADGDAEAGGKIFKQVCGRCHHIGPNARSAFGPQLNGIFGRHAAGTTDYQYSDPMKASGIVWDRETLTALIKDPDALVPGTRMGFWGISDPEKIENLLTYLQTFAAQ